MSICVHFGHFCPVLVLVEIKEFEMSWVKFILLPCLVMTFHADYYRLLCDRYGHDNFFIV